MLVEIDNAWSGCSYHRLRRTQSSKYKTRRDYLATSNIESKCPYSTQRSYHPGLHTLRSVILVKIEST